MERFFNWVGDPFVGVVLIIVAMLLSWLGSRRYRSQPKPKTRTLRTAEECIAYGVNPKYAGYYEILIEPAPTATAASIAPATPIAGAMPVPQMKLSTIADAPGSINVLIAGPKGSGKTTVLRTIITRRTGEMVALDPHNSPGKWPCAVVGGGLNWIAIDRALRAMSTNMQRRFVQLNSGEIGEGQFAQRLSVGDEFLSISQELNGRDGKAHAGKLLIERLVNGRKVGECVMVASQNDTVEALGIQGNADTSKAALTTSCSWARWCPPGPNSTGAPLRSLRQQHDRVELAWCGSPSETSGACWTTTSSRCLKV